MKRFKYQMKDGREIWVCEACKKSHAERILLKSWKLVDRKEDDSACESCSHPACATPHAREENCAHC